MQYASLIMLFYSPYHSTFLFNWVYYLWLGLASKSTSNSLRVSTAAQRTVSESLFRECKRVFKRLMWAESYVQEQWGVIGSSLFLQPRAISTYHTVVSSTRLTTLTSPWTAKSLPTLPCTNHIPSRPSSTKSWCKLNNFPNPVSLWRALSARISLLLHS